MPFPDPMTNVADFVAMFFGARLVTDAFETDLSILASVTQLVPQNPRRVALHITNNGNAAIAFSRLNTVTLTTGRLVAPGETWDLYWYNELREIEKNIFGITAFDVCPCHLREIVFV